MKKNKFFTIFPALLLIFFSCLNIQSQIIPKDLEYWTKPMHKCFEYEAADISRLFIASDNETLISSFFSGKIIALNSNDGKLHWNTEIGGEAAKEILSDQDNIYVLNEKITSQQDSTSEIIPNQLENKKTNASIHSLNITSGVANWKTDLQFEKGKIYIFLEQSYLILITETGNLYFINSLDGKISYTSKIEKTVTSVNIQNGTIFLGTRERSLITIPISNVSKLNHVPVKDIPNRILSNIGEKLYWTGVEGSLTVTNIYTGKQLWKRKFGAAVSSAQSASGSLLITSLDNFVYLLDNRTGSILWKRRLSGRISEKPFITSNVTILTTVGENSANILDLKNGKILNTITLSDANQFLSSSLHVNNQLIFPTLRGIYSYSSECIK